MNKPCFVDFLHRGKMISSFCSSFVFYALHKTNLYFFYLLFFFLDNTKLFPRGVMMEDIFFFYREKISEQHTRTTQRTDWPILANL